MSTGIDPRATAGIPFPPPIAFLGGLAVGFTFQHFFPSHLQRSSAGIDALELLGTVFVLAGVALASFAFVFFRKAGTSPFPERPTTALVVRGPFRYTRNPIYLSMSLVHAGMALFANALWPLLCLVPAVVAIRYFVIAREERHLLQQFGSEYAMYCQRVRRWL